MYNFLIRFINYHFSKEKQDYKNLKRLLGFIPGNLYLYKSAFRHKSVSKEVQNGFLDSNERLEFLGDAVLDSIIAEFLFKKFPYKPEGFLTEMRSKIVNREMLSDLAMKYGIDNFMRYFDLIPGDSGQFKSLHGNALEALIGAVFIDRGYIFTKFFTLKHIILPYINFNELETQDTNFKSRLFEWAQKEGKEVSFKVVEESGLEHKKKYKIEVSIAGESMGEAEDYTKKKAEQLAAQIALQKLILNNQNN